MIREFQPADFFTLANAACGALMVLSLMFALSGTLMISKTLRIPKL